MPSLIATDFHEGEATVQRILKIPPQGNPTSRGFPMRYAPRVMNSPLLALGTLDGEGRPWTTVWGGERGFARPVAEDVLGMNSVVDRRWDPVFEAFWAGSEGGDDEDGIVRGERVMAALAIDLETRDRLKLAGKMIAGAVAEESRVQLAMYVDESLGNCPKYLNKKHISPHGVDEAELAADGLPLCEEAVELLDRADLFFISSTNGESMDTNHRGGPPGFVRVMKNGEGEVVLVYPECELPLTFPNAVLKLIYIS